MIRNYFKTAWRNMWKNKFSSAINIGGLAVGMTVAIVIGLWLYDELSFDKYHQHYDRIARVQQHVTNNGAVSTSGAVPYPLANELRKNYGDDFDQVVLCADGGHILAGSDKKLNKTGGYFEPGVIDLLTLKMLKGSRNSLNDPSSIILSQSTAKAFFGDADPVNQVMKIDNRIDVTVTGVYEDLPANSSFSDMQFMAPWDLYFRNTEWVRTTEDPWRPNAFQVYVQLAAHADFATVSHKIKDSRLIHLNAQLAKKKPVVFLHPMSKWHLYSEFKDGVNTGGAIKYTWLFGIIGAFVLLLACINFMNLSTARSEKRAKEVGIRKAVGSVHAQLVYQFFCESVLIALFSFLLSMLLLQLLLPFINEVSGKSMNIPWNNPVFWLSCTGFSIITGLIAGSYPALYFSSFKPVKILKGTFRVGRLAAMPRKVLVVLQFSVSVIMIIGTLVVFRQIEYAKDRPIGYNTDGLINMTIYTDEVHKHFDAINTALLNAKAIVSMTESGSPTTSTWNSSSGFNWKGKDPNMSVDFSRVTITGDYGATIGWEFAEGRDFSKVLASDSAALIVNESAAKFMGLTNPVGETIRWFESPYTIIGVVKDLVMQNPYDPVRPTVFMIENESQPFVIARLNPAAGARESLRTIETVFKKFNPEQPFEYSFVDEEYAKKFTTEEQVGKLAGFFAALAIFISCLGLFGMASFVAEQRIKEIGVRKVLGASVFRLWQLLSKDFVLLVIIALVIAMPVAWYFCNSWLQDFHYRTDLSWWLFVLAGAGALLITLLTVSYQAIKAAMANPVKSLRE